MSRSVVDAGEAWMKTFESKVRRGGAAAMAEAGKFFMKTGDVYDALRRISSKLAELKIPYAVAGGMAVSAHGHFRTTEDVDILVDSAGLTAVHRELEGLGYVPPFAGSKNLRDVESGVRIEFLVAGQYPGDGKPKPVAFPNPADVSVEIDGIRYLRLPTLIELKLASGMTNALRQKDIGDVIDLIRSLRLPAEISTQLSEFVRPKYDELWNAIQQAGNADV
jgi:hypothetical protein